MSVFMEVKSNEYGKRHLSKLQEFGLKLKMREKSYLKHDNAVKAGMIKKWKIVVNTAKKILGFGFISDLYV